MERVIILVAVALILLAFLLPNEEILNKKLCEGDKFSFNGYYVSVRRGYLGVYYKNSQVYLVKGNRTYIEIPNVKVDPFDGCYLVTIYQKPDEALYLFVLGVSLIGAVIYYNFFVKYR